MRDEGGPEVPWGSGQSCRPLEPGTVVRIRPGLFPLSEPVQKCSAQKRGIQNVHIEGQSLRWWRSGSVVRPIIPAFRAEDPGSNPGRSIEHLLSDFPGARSLEVGLPIVRARKALASPESFKIIFMTSLMNRYPVSIFVAQTSRRKSLTTWMKV